jgi:hypothetical protein
VQACSDNYRLAQLQSWFPDTWAEYWIVTSQAAAIPQRSSSVSGQLRWLEQQEIRQLEQREQGNMAQQTQLENS